MLNKEKYKNHRVLVIGAGRNNPFQSHYGIEQALDKIGGEFLAHTDPILERKIIDFRPTHIITYANISKDASRQIGRIVKIKISERELRIIAKQGKKIEQIIRPRRAWWFWDLRHIDKHKTFRGWHDMVFLCNKEHIKEWHDILKVPVYYMPQCATTNILYKQHYKDDEVNWDVFFMGAIGKKKIHRDREKILIGLKKCFKVEIRNSLSRNARINIHHSSSYFYKHSPICLEISNGHAWGYTSNRPYEILANKGFLMIRYFKGIEDVFKNRKHCVWFKDLADAKKEITYYLKHPKERAKIAEAGYKLFLEKHTFDCRLENILDIMDGIENNYRGYLNK